MAEAYTYSYEPAWQKGDVISSLRLNNIENGIRRALNLIDDLDYKNESAPQEVTAEDAEKHYFNGFSQDRTLQSLTQENGLIHATTHTIAIKSYQIIDDAISYDANDPSGAGYKVVKTNEHGIIPSSLLPSYVDDIIECEDFSHFPSGSTDSNPDDAHTPAGPETGKIYVDLSTGRSYRWGGSEYVEVGVIHLNYNDDDNDSTNNTVNLSGDEQFGTDDAYFVNKVTQKEGQIQVTHRPFNLGTTWSADANNASTTPTLTISVGGNTHTTQNMPTATTAYYGATKLNHSTVIPDTASNDNTFMLSSDNTLAVTALGVKNAIEFLDVSDTAVGTQYVSQVSETDGKIAVVRANFDPAITYTSGTDTNAPTILFGVAGNNSNSNTATTFNKATTGLYGVTKLKSDTVNNNVISEDETLAVTSKGVKNAINTLNNTVTASSVAFISGIQETNGIIAMTETTFSPVLNHTVSTSSTVPYLSISIAGNESSAVALDTATTTNYGVTVLSNTQDSTNSTAAATPQGVWDAINQLDSTVTVNSTGYITGITQTNGKLATVTTAAFEPSLNITAAGNSAQELNLTVAGNTGANAITLATATTGVYGVTKLSDAIDNTSSGIAATSKAVKDSLDAAKSYADARIIPTVTTAEAGLMTPEQKHSIELFDDLINNFTFNLTLQLPTEVTWSRDDNTGVVTAVPKTFSTDTTVSYQMNDGNGWITYDGTQPYEGNHTFKAHVSRSHIFNGTTHTAEADISETYEYIQESAPEGE